MEVMVPPVTVKSRPATADKVAQSMSSLPVTVNTGLLVDCDAEGDVRVRIGGLNRWKGRGSLFHLVKPVARSNFVCRGSFRAVYWHLWPARCSIILP